MINAPILVEMALRPALNTLTLRINTRGTKKTKISLRAGARDMRERARARDTEPPFLST